LQKPIEVGSQPSRIRYKFLSFDDFIITSTSAGLSVQIQLDRGRFGPIRIFQKEKR